MNYRDFARTFQTLSNLGVVAGILLLVFELNQDRRLAEAQFLNGIQVSFQQNERLMLAADPAALWEKSVFEPSSLTAAEIRAMDAWFTLLVNTWYQLWLLEQRDLIDAGSTSGAVRGDVRFYLANHYGQLWWRHERENWGGELPFREMVDAGLEGVDPSTNARWIEQMQLEVKDLDVSK